MCDVRLRGASGRQWRQGGQPLTACFSQLLAERRVKRESEAEEKRVRLEAMRRETAAREARAQEQEEELRMLQSTQHKQASRIKEKGEAIKALTSQQETLAQAED